MTNPVLDTDMFTELKELMGETFSELISMTLETLPQQLEGITTAIENNNVENLFNVSHKMKSSCGSIGALGLAQKAEAIELIGRNGSTEVSEQMLNDLHDATHHLLAILHSELADNNQEA